MRKLNKKIIYLLLIIFVLILTGCKENKYTVSYVINNEKVAMCKTNKNFRIKDLRLQKGYYDFDGWYYNGKLWDFDKDHVTGNMELTATMIPIEYTATLKIDGDETYEIKHRHGEEFELPTKEGYYLVEENGYSIYRQIAMSTGNMTFFCSWEPTNAYKIVEDHAVLTKVYYVDENGKVKIPSTYEGYPVTTIARGAISGSNVKSIEMPNSIKVIEDHAIEHCYSLEEVILSDNLEIIYRDAFYNCENIKYNVYEGCCYLPSRYNEFYALINVRKVNDFMYINSQTEVIADSAFEGLYMSEVTLPSTLRSIGARAFAECKVINITIPDSVTYIGELAFGGCEKLTKAKLSSSLTEIPASMFSNCFKLEEVNIPSSITKIGFNAFSYCESLDNITLPEGLIEIEESAFLVTGITKIDIPESVTKIGQDILGGSLLKEITFGPNVIELNEFAFSGCNSLYKMTFRGSKEQFDQLNEKFGFASYLNVGIEIIYEGGE